MRIQSRRRCFPIICSSERPVYPLSRCSEAPDRGRQPPDALVYELCGLTKEENGIVEGIQERRCAERDLIMVKVQQKIAGNFRSWEGARIFCRIRGYISPVKKHSISVIDAIQGSI